MAVVRYCIINSSTGDCTEVINWDNATTYYPQSGFIIAGDNTGEVGWNYDSGASPGGTWSQLVASYSSPSDPVPIAVESGGTGADNAADARTNLGLAYASTTEVLTGTATDKVVNPDSLAALWELGSSIASASTISVGEGGFFKVTGTTTITDIDFAVDTPGRTVWLQFSGALTLTHNATTLILPGEANITTASGDTACFVSEGSDAVRCLAYTKANGTSVVGGSSTPNTQTFNSSGTWTKPSGTYNLYRLQIWAGGGSGGKGTSGEAGCGGGGGGYFEVTGPLSDLANTETVTVGLGGASQTTANTDGNNGGNSSFTLTNISKTYTVYGGGGGSKDGSDGDAGGGGGSVLGAGINGGTAVSGGVSRAGGVDAGNGGAAGGAAVAGSPGGEGTTGGGGGGGSSGDSTRNNGAGGDSIWGGAGGGAGAEDSAPGAGAGGTSVLGGNGGAGAFDANNATAGSAPGGGGGGSETGNSGKGGDGRIIITVW